MALHKQTTQKVFVSGQYDMTLDFATTTPAKQYLWDLFALTWLAEAAEAGGEKGKVFSFLPICLNTLY